MCKRSIVFPVIVLFSLALLSGCVAVDSFDNPYHEHNRHNPQNPDSPIPSSYYGVRFTDATSQRGVPLVVMTSNHGVRYISDSDGYVAIHRDVLRGQPLYFHVTSDGYQAEADDNGFRGVSVRPGNSNIMVIPLQRTNVAERLYRVTGEGIYRDSELLGIAIMPPKPRRTRGGVYGQDSVVNAIYDDKLYWFWGDTKFAATPLGLFKVSGAVSPMPANGVDPNKGLDLTYFVNEAGLSRAMTPLEGPGVIWISGLTVLEEQDRQNMFAFYSNRSDLATELGRGLVLWDDASRTFKQWVEFPEFVPLHPRGHGGPLVINEDGEQWLHYGGVFPQIRVRATLDEVRNPTRYQAYTCLQQGARWDETSPALAVDEQGRPDWAWRYDTDYIDAKRWHHLVKSKLVQDPEYWGTLVDADSGETVAPHGGHVTWNEHRGRWILIATQMFGSSMLGEVWYAEADSPLGPWSKARKVVTHDTYTFYNPKQHPYFAQGPYIYFEGTYTKTFSGQTQPTPRYDYNQIMYRLDLDDPRLQGLGQQ